MRVTIRDLRRMKRNGEKIPMITAYDYTSAQLVEKAGIPLILVGDSLGQVVLGYDSTVPVTMDEMVHHIRTVVRGTQRAHVVGDLPFLSYHADIPEAIRNAGRLLKEGGAQSVKLEGGRSQAETVSRIVESGIPVMGHIGLTPQRSTSSVDTVCRVGASRRRCVSWRTRGRLRRPEPTRSCSSAYQPSLPE